MTKQSQVNEKRERVDDTECEALGPAASHAVSLTLIVYIFGSCVAYTIIVADSFSAVIVGAAGAESLLASRDGVILVVAACVLLPLSLLRRTAGLAPASTLAVVARLYTTGAVVVKGCLQISQGVDGDGSGGGGGGSAGGGGDSGPAAAPSSSPDFLTTMSGGGGVSGGGGGGADWKSGTFTLGGRVFDLWRFDEGTVLALPILVFAFQCHIQAVTAYHPHQQFKPPQLVCFNPFTASKKHVFISVKP